MPDLRERAADSPNTTPEFAHLQVFDVDFDTSKPLLRQLGVQTQGDSVLRPHCIFGMAARLNRDSDRFGQRPEGICGWLRT